jgi:GMP synthase-like glutamine amidotransferase
MLELIKFVHRTFDAQIPIVGICFGHQILARALGVEVGRNADGWEVAVDRINLSEKGQELFGLETLV